MSKNNVIKSWPSDCVWPEPIRAGEGDFWDFDLANVLELDEDGEKLLEVKEYMDRLVESGRLNEDYSLNEDFDPDDDNCPNQSFSLDEDAGLGEEDLNERGSIWLPELAIDYWDEGFDLKGWENDFSNHINLLKIDVGPSEDPDPVSVIREIIHYSFINENLLRQAFTRRSFQIEYGLSGCSEELEFYGDQVLAVIVTREIFNRFSKMNTIRTDAPFDSLYSEGALSRMRTRFVSKEHLSARAEELGLDQFILYGAGEEAGESSREDMMEALIGAVAVDCGWNQEVLEDVVDHLIRIQLDDPDSLVKATYFEQLNTWHQKHFGRIPEYEVFRRRQSADRTDYICSIRFEVPKNDRGIRTCQRIVAEEVTRSSAREYAAKRAVCFIEDSGLWMNLEDAGISPDPENSINQLQELKQKKYVGEIEYSFEQRSPKEWSCRCVCDSFDGWGRAVGKTRAKKKAAYMVLVRIMKSAGICKPEWESLMWQMMEG